VFFFSCISVSQASVVVGGTRVIFDGTQKTTTVSVQNKDNVTNIVQSWISVDDNTCERFIYYYPSAVRLKAGEQGFVAFSVQVNLCRKIGSRCFGSMLKGFLQWKMHQTKTWCNLLLTPELNLFIDLQP
jgi:nitrous oxide reductase